jgi:hypothetical protein
MTVVARTEPLPRSTKTYAAEYFPVVATFSAGKTLYRPQNAPVDCLCSQLS